MAHATHSGRGAFVVVDPLVPLDPLLELLELLVLDSPGLVPVDPLLFVPPVVSVAPDELDVGERDAPPLSEPELPSPSPPVVEAPPVQATTAATRMTVER